MPQLSKSTQTSLSEINMVPFVDVVLVLLIIFMITAPILQSGIEVDVPKTRTVKEINQERLVVTVDKGQRIYLGNEPTNIHQLGPRIKDRKSTRLNSSHDQISYAVFCLKKKIKVRVPIVDSAS